MIMQEAQTNKFKKFRVRLHIPNLNMHLYQEIIEIKVYKVPQEAEAFGTANKTYIGSALVAWKECVEREDNGASESLQFNEELREYGDSGTARIDGKLAGEARWIKYGHGDSKYDPDGTKRPEKKLAKTAEDFKGAKVGEGGSLQLMAREYQHPEAMSLNEEYVVHYKLTNDTGDLVGESITDPANNDFSRDDPSKFTWKDQRQIAVNDIETDTILYFTVMTKPEGLKQGRRIAQGQLDFNDVEGAGFYKAVNEKGFAQKKSKFHCDLDGSDEKGQLVLQFKFKPAKKPGFALPTDGQVAGAEQE